MADIGAVTVYIYGWALFIRFNILEDLYGCASIAILLRNGRISIWGFYRKLCVLYVLKNYTGQPSFFCRFLSYRIGGRWNGVGAKIAGGTIRG